MVSPLLNEKKGGVDVQSIIRPMGTRDKSQVLEMMRIFYASPAVFTDGSEEIFNADFDNCIGDNPYIEGYIFEGADGICGYAMVAKSFSTEFGKPCIWIEDIFIKDEYRGRGIGSLFLNYIENKYPHAVFRLEVEEENERAVSVYKKCGYGVLPYMDMKKEP
jgi:GNAT superfamily N-acetyltransferase